jgi:hypothetical protein
VHELKVHELKVYELKVHELKVYEFLTETLHAGEWLVSRSSRFTNGEVAQSTHWLWV